MKKKVILILSLCILTMAFSGTVLADETYTDTSNINFNMNDNSARADYWAWIPTEASGTVKVPPNTYVPGASAYYVKLLQCCLNKIGGYGLSTDGVFGTNTQNAIKDFQQSNALGKDGVAGLNTWRKISYIIEINGWKIKF